MAGPGRPWPYQPDGAGDRPRRCRWRAARAGPRRTGARTASRRPGTGHRRRTRRRAACARLHPWSRQSPYKRPSRPGSCATGGSARLTLAAGFSPRLVRRPNVGLFRAASRLPSTSPSGVRTGKRCSGRRHEVHPERSPPHGSYVVPGRFAGHPETNPTHTTDCGGHAEEGRRHRDRGHHCRGPPERDVPGRAEQRPQGPRPHQRQDAAALHPHPSRRTGSSSSSRRTT